MNNQAPTTDLIHGLLLLLLRVERLRRNLPHSAHKRTWDEKMRCDK